jgi:capsular polysaccharide transport system permease protein
MVSKLQDELIGARTQLAQLRSLAPENPQIPLLETRIGSLGREIDVALGKVAGDRTSLSSTAAQYQRLQLEREYADRRLTAALTSLQDARNEGQRKQAYVERIVQPNLPDEALEPRRWRGVLATLVLGLIAYAIASMLLAGIREHKD